MNEPYDFEIEPEVREWLEASTPRDFKKVDEVAGMLAELGPELGGPWAAHLDGPVWELRLRLRNIAPRVTYWITPMRTIVLLTVFRKTRQHEKGQIDRALRAQKFCEGAHHGPVAETYERKA